MEMKGDRFLNIAIESGRDGKRKIEVEREIVKGLERDR